VAAIHLVITDHTQAPKGQDHTRLLERLNQKSLAALKQAKKPWLTEIHAPVPLRSWRAGHPGNLIVVHPGEDDLPPLGEDPFYLLTGPEGGFSDGELGWLSEDGKSGRLGLGRTRIRGTHAPLLACGKLMGKGTLA
jgi:16S rRNA U1498 N3-methylase RsmE